MARPPIFLAALAAVTLLPATASAFEYVSIGVGVIGHAGACFIDEPDPEEQTIMGAAVDPDYPGFAGLALGVGPMIDVRFIEYVGFEFDVLRTEDKGSADIEISDNSSGAKTSYDIEISNPAFHLPLLVKGTYPGEYINVNAFVGPEFVIPDDPAIVIDPVSGNPGPKNWSVAKAESYTMVTFGLGIEFVIPQPLDVVSFRIPIQLRLSANPGLGSTREERSTNLASEPRPPLENGLVSESFITEWQYQTVAAFGVSAHF